MKIKELLEILEDTHDILREAKTKVINGERYYYLKNSSFLIVFSDLETLINNLKMEVGDHK